MVIIFLCVLPLLFFLMPYSYDGYSFFDVNLLHYSDSGNTFSVPSSIFTNNLTSNEALSNLEVLSIVWLIIYIIGFIAALGKVINGLNLVHSIIKTSDQLDACSNLNPIYLEQLKNLQNTFKIRIKVTQLDVSPFVYQFGKKYLILPENLFKGNHYTHEQINLILNHELNHLKNHDQLYVLMSHFIVCIVWFNPFVRYFIHQLNWAIEANCDSEVLKHKPHLRKIYAQTMLKILRQSATKTSNHLVAAFSTKTHRSLTMRINNIMKPLHPEVKLKNKKKKLWLSALIVAFAMFLTQPQTFAASKDNKLKMINPVKHAKVTSKYGANNKFHQFHKGIDLGAAMDTPIVATSNGVVRISTDHLENKKNYGTIIIIDHDEGFHSVYAHLNSRTVNVGDRVTAGQLIGHVGETGKATGPHLHLELLKDNKHVNPSDFIQF